MTSLGESHAIFLLLLQQNSNQKEPFSLPSGIDWGAVIQVANEQYLGPYLFKRLQKKGVSLPVHHQIELKKAYLRNSGRNMAVMAVFEQLLAELDTANIPVIPLKGLYLAAAYYDNPGERIIGDLDLLVPRHQIATAVEKGQRCGFFAHTPIQIDAWLAQKHQIAAQYHATSKLILEWHWHLMAPQSPGVPPIQDFWQRALPTAVFPKPARTLTREDLILHLAYHIAYHHDFLFGLRSLCDLDLVCQQTGIGWQKVVERSQSWGLARGLFLVLKLAKTLLNSAIPEWVVNQLQPNQDVEMQLDLAVQQLFVPPEIYQQIPKTQRLAGGTPGLGQKARKLVQTLFPSPHQLAIRYGLPVGSHHLLNRTVIRWTSLARQGWHYLKRPAIDGPRAAANRMNSPKCILDRKKALTAWLNAVK